MKKICIVTVYNSQNCGSFLQAYSLQKKINSLGYDVYFYKRSLHGTQYSFLATLTFSLKKIIKGDFASGINYIKKYKRFIKAVKIFNIIDEKNEVFNKIDCFVIGSDTVWNFETKSFYDNKDTFTGKRFNSKKITYAASAGNTKLELFQNNEDIKVALNNLNAISVRDKNTADIIKSLLNKNTEIVVDPTMLLTKKDFEEIESKNDEKDYILIYYFGKIPTNLKNDILTLGKKYNKKIISFGENLSWCDKTIIYNPYDLLSYFHNADFIITNTFHGTIFSIIYEKNFSNYGIGKKKVENILEQLNLSDHIDKDGNIELIYNKNIDYKKVKNIIKDYSKKSSEYLIRELGDKNEK